MKNTTAYELAIERQTVVKLFEEVYERVRNAEVSPQELDVLERVEEHLGRYLNFLTDCLQSITVFKGD